MKKWRIIMKNKCFYKFIITKIIIILLFHISITQNNINPQQLLNTAKNLEKINQFDQALEIYMQLFEEDGDNKIYFKKIKKILKEKEAYEELIKIYQIYISNIDKSKDKFFIEIELLELKIWQESENWKDNLNYILESYIINPKDYNYRNKKNNIRVIYQKLISNNKVEEAHELIKNMRSYFKFSMDLFEYSKNNIFPFQVSIFKNNTNTILNNLSYKDTTFLSREMVSIFLKNNKYKESIDEAFLFLKTNYNNKKYPYNELKKAIFASIDKILEDSFIYDFKFPITNKQFNANTFLNYQILKKYESEDIQYVINIYNKLIKNNIAVGESKLRLANITYDILYDLDSAYEIYSELEYENVKKSIKLDATIQKIDILITKGYLDSASVIINDKIKEFEKYKSLNQKNDMLNFLQQKNMQLLFYKGNYSEMLQALNNLINENKLDNQYLNDLLEIKTIALFFNENQNSFKKYASIQHKIKMNKIFEANLELVELIKSDNILISELAQFQYALILIKKGNIKEAQTIIELMDGKTIFSEISLIINAEIEDYINQNYEFVMQLYQNILNKYPNSIYKENIIKRLNIINQFLNEEIEL